MINIDSISLAYGSHTVMQDFTAQIHRGTITAIVGSNGVGKSTLLSAIAGELKISSGQLQLESREISSYSLAELAEVRSVAQQSHGYWMAYTAHEILLLGNESVSDERLSYLTTELGLTAFLHQRITELSGGQLQRIEIARAFMRELPLVLLDEPFASQDLASQGSLIEFFKAERELGRTIILVAHRDPGALEWCDQIIDLN
jgi:ABC-type cobalamin/Fe3+-siderophores transport system ATPase subunit